MIIIEDQNKKRHPSLQPLSRHHHHALVMAQMLIKQEKEPHDIKMQLRDFWHNGGRNHFHEEEDYLFPEYAKYVDQLDHEIVEALIEHVIIRSLIDDIVTSTTFIQETSHRLGYLLRDHVFREERVIFPMIQQVLSEESLKKIEPHFSEHFRSPGFNSSH